MNLKMLVRRVSCLVAGVGEISNFDLVRDLIEVVDFIDEYVNESYEITNRKKHVV
jgi:hypothetical protein